MSLLPVLKTVLAGKTDGIELSYQQSFGDFGVTANYTCTNAERDEERDLTKPGSGLKWKVLPIRWST